MKVKRLGRAASPFAATRVSSSSRKDDMSLSASSRKDI